MIVTKMFKTLKDAERYQSKLYEKYSTVRCMNMPQWSFEGVYTWLVG